MPIQTLLFLGPQGCGKGTQIELIKKVIMAEGSRPVVHFEMGKNLRELAGHDDFTGRHTGEVLLEGGLVPYVISASVFANYLIKHLKTNDEHLLIDGFPRTPTQLPALDSALTDFYKRHNPTVVVINISDEESVQRLLKRGRSDDTEESIRKRLAWSHEETMPNIAWFKNNPAYRVVEVNGEQPIEAVHADVRAALNM